MSDEKENRVITFIMSRGRTVALRVCKIVFEESIVVIDEILDEDKKDAAPEKEEKDIEPSPL